MSQARWSAPGPRTIETRQGGEKGDLWTPVRVACVGVLVTDAILLVPVIIPLLVGWAGIPIGVTFSALLCGYILARKMVNGQYSGPQTKDAAVGLVFVIGIVGLSIGIGVADGVWNWLSYGFYATSTLIRQIFDPFLYWAVPVIIAALFIVFYARIGMPVSISIALITVLCVAWGLAWYDLLHLGTWYACGPVIWDRIRIVMILMVLPIPPWGAVLMIRLIVEALAGDVLPVKMLPVDPLQVRNLLWLLFPHRKQTSIIARAGPAVPDEHRLYIHDAQGKGQDLSMGIPVAKKDPDGFSKFALAVLRGEATISESGSKDDMVNGATHYGYTQKQWRGIDKNEQGYPQTGLRTSLQRLLLIEGTTRKSLTPMGYKVFVWWVVEHLGSGQIPERFKNLIGAVTEETISELMEGSQDE